MNTKVKKYFYYAQCLLIAFILFAERSYAANVTVIPTEDNTSFIKNPQMGWVLYADCITTDANDNPFLGTTAAGYWSNVGNAYQKASVFYIRIPWSQLEPTEGNYAWNNDANFKALIQGALDRGLKLAFRVFVNSKDCYRQATPDFVRNAGALQSPESNGFWDPDVRNAIFQNKFWNFCHAFAAKYDNPDIVDFVDVSCLGAWGEMYVSYANQNTDGINIYKWNVLTYTDSFKHVQLGIQYSSGTCAPYSTQNSEIAGKGLFIRRDSFGSPLWLSSSEKNAILGQWSMTGVGAENCYFHMSVWSGGPWQTEGGYATVSSCMQGVYNDAIQLHANTLDLRGPIDANAWISLQSTLVNSFNTNGGYRLVPTQITYPGSITAGTSFSISHNWKNTGIGRMLNDKPNWNYKYKVGFALLNSSGQVVSQAVTVREPSLWLKGNSYNYIDNITFSGNIVNGIYTLAVAVVDVSKIGTPAAINLAVSNTNNAKWYSMGSVSVVQNLLTNPGFETGDLTGWNSSDIPIGSSFVQTGGYSGTYAGTQWNANAYTSFLGQWPYGIPNGTYTLSVWTESSGGQKYCLLAAKNYGGNEIDAAIPSGGWTQTSISGIQVTNGQCQVGIWSDANAGNWVFIDDFSFTMTGPLKSAQIINGTNDLPGNTTSNIIVSSIENAWILSGIPSNSKINVINVCGKLLFQLKSVDNSLRILSNGIPSGIYLIQIEHEGLKHVIKVMK